MSAGETMKLRYCLKALSLFILFTKITIAQAELDPIFYESTNVDLSKKLYDPDLSVEEWVDDLDSENLPLLCLGERHDDKFRQFYSDFFFSRYTFDVLFMEATQEEVDSLVSRSLGGEEYVSFLGANIAQIIRTVASRNSEIEFIGVELTRGQKNEVQSSNKLKSREGFIAQNIFDNFSDLKKSVMLYGANHCAYYDIGLGRKTPAIRHLNKVIPKEKMRSVRLVFHHPSQYFSASLHALNLPEHAIVFKNSNLVPDEAFNYIWDFKKHLVNFDDVIYAR